MGVAAKNARILAGLVLLSSALAMTPVRAEDAAGFVPPSAKAAQPPAPPTLDAAHPTRIVYLSLVPLGIDAATAKRVSATLGKALGEVPGVALVADTDLDAARAKDPSLAGCHGQTKCVDALGKATGAPAAVTGVLSTLGDARSLDLRLLDVDTGAITRRIAETWRGKDDTLLESMREAATKLLAPKDFTGTLALTTNVKGVKVYLDGDYLGRTPLAKKALAPGRHVLRLSSPDYVDLERFVDVPFHQTVPVTVHLESLAVKAVVKARPKHGPIDATVRLGIVTNLGAMSGPTATLAIGYTLPFWGERLSIAVESGLWGGAVKQAIDLPGSGSVPVKGQVLAVPIEGHLLLHLLADYPFSPFVGAGGGAVVAFQTVSAAPFSDTTRRSTVPALQIMGGVAWRLAGGELRLEVRYEHAVIASSGLVDGQVGGLGVSLGYELHL